MVIPNALVKDFSSAGDFRSAAVEVVMGAQDLKWRSGVLFSPVKFMVRSHEEARCAGSPAGFLRLVGV